MQEVNCMESKHELPNRIKVKHPYVDDDDDDYLWS